MTSLFGGYLCCVGGAFLEPRKPHAPAEDVAKAPPLLSVKVTIVLLNVAKMWICPNGIERLDFFFLVVFGATVAAVLVMSSAIRYSLQISYVE